MSRRGSLQARVPRVIPPYASMRACVRGGDISRAVGVDAGVRSRALIAGVGISPIIKRARGAFFLVKPSSISGHSEGQASFFPSHLPLKIACLGFVGRELCFSNQG